MKYSTGMIIGRFQPFHAGHQELLRAALVECEKVVIVLGSANGPRSLRNPFTPAERTEMITANFSDLDLKRIGFVEVRDYFYNNAAWTNEVREKVGSVAAAGQIAVFGHVKDATSVYLKWFSEWPLVQSESNGDHHATSIREAYLRGTSTLAELSAPTREWLQKFSTSPAFARLQEEQLMVDKYKASWATAPFPPTFVTADALVVCASHILLIQRKRPPGRGLWALPGGFLDPEESLLNAALRELAEETNIAIDTSELIQSLATTKVFDHPLRSSRGRTITHAHLFRIDRQTLPRVQASDDAAAAKWIPLLDLSKMEDQIFEDHFHIISKLADRSVDNP